jgi:excisionase family DNA binding protein
MDVFNTWLTIAEGARYVRLSRATVYQRIAEGAIRPRKIGGRVLLAREELDALIEASAAPAKAAS